MKKIVVIMDSFKDTIDVFDIIKIGKNAAKEVFGDENVPLFCPMADGGENTACAISYILNATDIKTTVYNVSMKEINATYCMDEDNNAYLDVASVVGFNSNKDDERKIKKATSFGVGQLIKDAISKGAKKVYLGLGGSLTNDVACGALMAFGAKFYNNKEEEVLAIPQNFLDITKVVLPYNKEYEETELVCLCDVTNPLYGENGAAQIFSRQKGASEQDVLELEQSVIHISKILQKVKKLNPNDPGMGAAGGMKYGLNVIFDVDTQSGAKFLLELIDFYNIVDQNTIVITGEGRLDSQSFQGKVIGTIADEAKKAGAMVYTIVGTTKLSEEELKQFNIDKCWKLNDGQLPIEVIRAHAKDELYNAFLSAFEYAKNDI